MYESCYTSEDCVKASPFSYCNESNVCSCRPGERIHQHDGKNYCYMYDTGEECTDFEHHRQGCLGKPYLVIFYIAVVG